MSKKVPSLSYLLDKWISHRHSKGFCKITKVKEDGSFFVGGVEYLRGHNAVYRTDPTYSLSEEKI